MATMKTIRVTFERAERQSRNLKSCAQDLRTSYARLGETVETLGTAWQGEAASLYLEKCEQLRANLQKTIQNLEKTADTVHRSAQAYYDAEKRALELIATKSTAAEGKL